MTRTRTGVWFVGARGNVAATAITGARGIARGPCTRLALPEVDELVFAGHDIVERPLLHTATELADSGVVDRATLEAYVGDHRGDAESESAAPIRTDGAGDENVGAGAHAEAEAEAER